MGKEVKLVLIIVAVSFAVTYLYNNYGNQSA
jgi:hypothetical protein